MIQLASYDDLLKLESSARTIQTITAISREEFEFIMQILGTHIDHILSIKEDDIILPTCQVFMEDYNGKTAFFTVIVNTATIDAFSNQLEGINKAIKDYKGKYILVSAQAVLTINQAWEGIDHIEREEYTYKIDAIKSTIYTRCGQMDFATEIKGDGERHPVVIDATSEFDQIFGNLLT